MGVAADVGDVGVAVVADHPAVAVGAEQRALGQERLDADVREGPDHLVDRVEQRLELLAAAGVEGDDPASGTCPG